MLINELSVILKVSQNTVRSWEKEFNISVKRDHKNNRIYDDIQVKIYQQIKELKEAGNSIESIKQLLACNLQVTYKQPTSNLLVDGDIRAIIKAEIQEQTELSEKYAKATYTIGKQEERILTLENQIKLLPAPDEFNRVKCENDFLNRDKELLQQQLQQAQEELTLLKMPWYRKLFMRLQVAKV